MKIFPAIDLINGQTVRLTRGDYNRKEVYADDPNCVLDKFIRDGAKYLHVVDLDGAKTGATVNFSTVKELCSRKEVFLEIGGGIRDEKRIEQYLNLGAGRVILGTAALNNFDFLKSAVKAFGDKIAVGIDAKDGKVAVRGWLDVSATDGYEFCLRCRDAGVKTIIYTDIETDGAMQGTNLPLFEKLSKIDGLDVTASGGIVSYDEIIALREMNISAAILGKALYTGVIDLKKAIAYGE